MIQTLPIILSGFSSTREDDCYFPEEPLPDIKSSLIQNGACADAPIPSCATLKNDTSYIQTKGIFVSELPHDFRVLLSPYASNGPSVLNKNAWARWQDFSSPHSLANNIDQTLVQQKLIQSSGFNFSWQQPKSQILTIWMHVTNACDLECPYCYVRKSSARMSKTAGEQVLKTIFETAIRHGFQQVKLKYAGGEATLHFKMIQYLHNLAQAYSMKTGVGLSAVVLSNGVNLRPEMVSWLKDNNIRLMLSLDGVGELHDQLRSRKSGRGTFESIAHMIDNLLLPQGLHPYITMTVTQINAQGAADLAQWAIVERKLPVNFNLYRKNLLSASHYELELEEEIIISGLRKAYSVIETTLPDEPILGGLLDRVQATAHTHTCGVGQNYAVITHTGKLAECHMHLENAESIQDDLFASGRSQTIFNLSVDKKEGCRDCAFRYRCTGGCPVETYRVTGRWDIKSPHCKLYKTLLPYVIRLQGLQLLKINGLLATSEFSAS